jgi:Lysine-specific metallo-endopeptidase
MNCPRQCNCELMPQRGRPLEDCIVSNTAEIARAMNRTAFIRISEHSIEDEAVTGKLPKPKPKSQATASTVDCHQSEQNDIAVAYPMAIDMVNKALEVMTSDTTDRKALLEKWFNDSSVSTVLHVRAGFLRPKQGITSSFNFECEHKGEWFYDHYCDKTNGYVIKYFGIRVHLCEDMFGRAAPQMAKTIVHECSHKFDFTDDEENCPYTGCSKSLNRWDAIDNAYSYGWFAFDAYHL